MLSFLLLVLCGGGEPGIQELLAVVDLPGVDLHRHHYEQVEDGDGRKAEDEAVRFAVPVQLLRHGEHLHGTIDYGRDAKQPGADHGHGQVTDGVPRQRHEAQCGGNDAQQVRVLPLVGAGHQFVGEQIQLAHHHLG